MGMFPFNHSIIALLDSYHVGAACFGDKGVVKRRLN
jgi:hypothetical protein